MSMDIENVLIPTIIIKPGMTVRDLFTECGKQHVQALPFCNEEGILSGRLTLKNVMKFSCLPEHMIELASLLGNQMSCVENAEEKAREIICSPVEPYVRSMNETISSKEPLIKALAMMERNNTSYIFVVDDGDYKGQVTIQGIAQVMSSLDNSCAVP
ncbi:MAG: CBS domain-containing protein [gamma proteobacterium symbiont of Lucinoma myriamae]|nr:CBS domain-containing protein [gamma proteobacterium symbiont of Lucinoma myriamae]MCU7820035.1 CBS domain-containing protein [gamma proteobacterium symbiont of Lucinoma myriamae]MCU7832642.1 CBS domain-containing protein [gamma proteobacterium symbiont of Lucinoma myriamae]